MGQSIDECELLTGTRSAEGIMASGPVSRTHRPNRWLLRPALQRALSLDSLEPSTDGPKRTFAATRVDVRFSTQASAGWLADRVWPGCRE